tara:strand:- start:1320 stop:1823 length:504 start_codon:yes stop_codon:yes gene_type:complete
MPTSQQEAFSIVEILDEYLDENQARELTARLEQEIGQKTDNDSLKVSLEMLKALYIKKPNKIDYAKKALLYALIVFHIFVIIVNIAAFFILPFMYPLYVWMPLNSFILVTTFTREICPLTRLENKLRTSLGMSRIGGFIGHYFVRPIKRLFSAKAQYTSIHEDEKYS